MKKHGHKCIKEPKTHFCSFLTWTPPNSGKVNEYCWCFVLQRDRVTVMLSVLLYSILSALIVYSVQLNCTDSNYRETEWLLCWASYCTAHLLYKCCTDCTFCNWTVLTVITQKLLLHVQLHNCTAHLQYK